MAPQGNVRGLSALHDAALTRLSTTGPRRAVLTLVVGACLYSAAWAAGAFLTAQTPTDLDLYFWPSAQIAVHGHPLLVYSAPSLGGYPNANGPLGLVALVPVAAVANALVWANDLRLRAGLSGVEAALANVALAAVAVTVISRARGGVTWRAATPLLFLLAPPIWISVADYGHLEQPIELALTFVAVAFTTQRRIALAGVVLGLAALTRTTAVLYVVPFAFALLAGRHYRDGSRFLILFVVTIVLGVAPFALADGRHVLFSLITYRAQLPIGGGSLWVVAYGTPLAGVVQHADAYVIGAVVLMICGVAAWRRPSVVVTAPGLLGMLTIAAACFPMLAKTAYPYYLLEPYVFGTAWWLARPENALSWRASVPVLLVADTLFAKAGAALPVTGLGVAQGVASSCVLAVVIGLIAFDLVAADVSTAAASYAPEDPTAASRRLGENLSRRLQR
ncbi:MAG: hypothetical protein ACREN2_10160 [Candidatus Dormibacteria bacterium]